uniref:TNFR-Cys domain-containing protein n=1 Tax=Takifugu rubripes TaxID=31033 RepID=A0A3B5KJ86_TAKRU
MAVTLWMMLLCLLMHGSFCINEHIERGCLKWSLDKTDENNVCCDVCRPGNHLVKPCGPSPEELCTPCKPNRFMVQPNSLKCSQCTQCVGMCILLEKCTPTRDTVCGCKEGLMCGDDQCSFCVTACVNGTFYDQMQQRCKPWMCGLLISPPFLEGVMLSVTSTGKEIGKNQAGDACDRNAYR